MFKHIDLLFNNVDAKIDTFLTFYLVPGDIKYVHFSCTGEKKWTSEQTDLTPLEINFRYMLKTIKTASTKVIMSKKAIIWGCPVTFDHLWKIRAPLNIVEGFDLSHFDEVIMNACNIRWLHMCYSMVQSRILIPEFKTTLSIGI